jgi:hypothetical protein
MSVTPPGAKPQLPEDHSTSSRKKKPKALDYEQLMKERFEEPFGDELLTPDEQKTKGDSSKISRVYKKEKK